jgi:hypothetical protein
MPFDFKKQAQTYYSHFPVIILGSGSSMALGLPGMSDLANYIQDNILPDNIPNNEQSSWCNFCELLKNKKDLENALSEITFSDEVTNIIIEETWKFINQEDEIVYKKSILEKDCFPLGDLLSHMFKTSHKEINIVTTNYDRLAEYACDQKELYHYSGFSHGYTRKIVSRDYIKCARTVNIWKVHGSLDWFCNADNETISVVNSNLITQGLSPQIVTPGKHKFQKTHLEPYRTIITSADAALEKANSYLCIGFGFNDEHIQPKLLEKCKNQNARITIITHTLTDKTNEMLGKGIKNYLAIERNENDNSSRIHSSEIEDPIIVEGNFWSLNGFLTLII